MYLARRIDLRSFISPMYQKMYENFGLHNNGHMLVLGDPIDFPKLMRENNTTEHSYRDRIKKTGPLLLFFSSRMAPGKGFDLILAAFAKVKNKDNFRLVLGGSGPEEEKIHQMAKDLGIAQFIEFPGWMERSQLFEFYKKADIYIQVGWRPEGTSISLLYAMAFGLPSIVPNGSGMAWQAQHSALTAANGDHEGLARQIERLGRDSALRKELSKNCYARINDEQLDHKKAIATWFGEMKKIKEYEKTMVSH
jgi:glycosyltransferase involved in cell wall biosynthesis